MSVTMWPENAKNWTFCTPLYPLYLQLRAKFLFSWLEKLADLLSWLEKQAQLNLWTRFRNSANMLRLHQNWRKCIPNKILRCLEVRIFKVGSLELILYAKAEFHENGCTVKVSFCSKMSNFQFFSTFPFLKCNVLEWRIWWLRSKINVSYI